MLIIFVVIGILVSIIILCVSNNLRLRKQLQKNMREEQKNQKIMKILNEKDPSIMGQMYEEQGLENGLSEGDIRSKIEVGEMRSPVMNILGILRKQFIPPTIIEEKNEETQEEEYKKEIEQEKKEQEEQEEVTKDKEI